MWFLLVGAGLSGFVSLGFEVVSFRVLTLVYGSTTYSFSAMLSVFLAGIAMGSMVFSRFSRLMKYPVFWFAVTQMGTGVCMVLALHQFNSKPEFLLRHLLQHGLVWRNLVTAQFLITFSLLFLPTFFFGGAFAVVAKALREASESSSRTAGELYAFNTVGAMAGALITGFVLLSTLGIERTVLVLVILSTITGLAALFNSGVSASWVRITAGAVALWFIALLFGPPHLNEKIISAGAYFAPWNYLRNGRVAFQDQLRSERLLLYREGRTATVSTALSHDETLQFVVNGKVEADTSARSMILQRMMGHLPMLFHANPRRVLNIGLGAGMTLGALGCYPVERFEVVEIEPVVKEATRIFGKKNDHVVDRSDLVVTINDGRNLLLATSRQYDVITSDPFEPVAAGAANLYTVEHFEQAKARLAHGGIMAQYVPLYEMSKEDYATIVRTFVHVFPSSLLFYTGFDTILVGWKDDCMVDIAAISRKFEIPSVRRSLAEVGFEDAESVFDMFVGDMRQTKLPSFAELNTDGHPVIEFSAPKNTLRYMPDTNQRILLACLTDIPGGWIAGMSSERAQRVKSCHEALKLTLSSSVCRADGENEKAFGLLTQAIGMAPQSPVVRNEFVAFLTSSAQNLLEAGELPEASMQYQVILNYSPSEFWPLYHMVNLAMRARDPKVAALFLERGLRYYPESPLMIALRGKYRGTMGDVRGACDDLRTAIERLPEKVELWEDYAIFLKAAGDEEEAKRAEEEARRLRL
jgi:spermidine synthase